MHNSIAWHYTTGKRLSQILQTRILKREAGLPAGVRAAVWLTLSSRFAPTARKGIIVTDGGQQRRRTATHDEQCEFAGGLARIGVDVARVPHTWDDYRRVSGESRSVLRALERTAREVGDDPSLWRVSFGDLYPPEWTAVERWDGSAWKPAWSATSTSEEES